MLEVQRFLTERSLEDLAARYAVSARRHAEHPNLVMLKYSQIESPMGERIVQECRGLILDEADGWRIVAAPYYKFFNHGEPHAAAIDWESATVYDKLDGSLLTLYHYGGRWCVASSGLPDARGPTNGPLTFAELFWETWRERGYVLPEETQLSFMWELMTPHNRIVVQYPEPRLVLHGLRHRETLEEECPEPYALRYGWDCVRSYTFGSLEVVLGEAAALRPLEGEGYVVRDSRFNRVKVKSSQYVALSNLRASITERGLLEFVRKGEGDEFLAYFPELRPRFEELRAKYEQLVEEVARVYEGLRGIEAQKEFAMQALPHRFSGLLFNLRSGKSASIREFLLEMPVRKLEHWLGVELRETGLEE